MMNEMKAEERIGELPAPFFSGLVNSDDAKILRVVD